VNAFDLPLCSAAIAVPLLGALAIRGIVHRDHARAWSVVIAIAALAVAVAAAIPVYTAPEHPFFADPWQLAVSGLARPMLGIDGLSAALVVFVALVTLITLIAAPRGVLDARAASALLLGESMTLLAFCALDGWLLVLGWTASLIPGFTEIRRNAQPKDVRPASRIYAMYLFSSAVLLGIAMALLARFGAAAGLEAPLDLPALATSVLPRAGAWTIIVLLAVAILLREGIVPFHSWVPALFERVPPLVLVPTVVPQLGAYLLVRVAIPAFPGMIHAALPSVADLALFTAIYGAFVGLAQRDLHRAVGSLVMSQSALVFVGLECDNVEGVAGGLILWITVGLAMTGLMLSVAAIDARVGPRELRRFTGLAQRAPWLAALFLILGLANVWLPGTLGFVGEDMLVHGVLATYPGVGIAVIVASAINGFSVLRAFSYVFLGPPPANLPAVGALLSRERVALVGVVVLLAIGGVFPGPAVAMRSWAAHRIVERSSPVTHGSPSATP